MQTVPGLLEGGNDDDPALETVDGESLSWAEARAQVSRLADELRAAGAGVGDRIAIVLPNGPAMALAFLAATTVGCAAPLNPRYREEELRFYLGDLGAKVLVIPDGEQTTAEAALPDDAVVARLRGDFPSYEIVAPAGSGASSGPPPVPDDVALVLHTSGTTSRPKIVPLRQRNIVASARNIASWLQLGPSDRSLNVMPLFHIHGLMAGLLAPLSVGGAVVVTPGFDAFRIHGWIDRLQPTYYTAVPTMHQMVLARAPERRQTSLRFVRSSSASLPAPVLEALTEQFGVPVVESYGMTEASHQMTSNPVDGEIKARSVGLPAGVELAILDVDGAKLRPGERGEVAIRGPGVVDGYENNPEANAAAFTNGWFRTGDEGVVDDDGYLFLTGRLKEQINRGGEKISPLEIDEVLLRHPAVAQAVAFAVPHQKLGEDVAAAVVLADGAEADERELRDHAAASLAAFKVPRRIVFVDEIPKGATGKLQRIGLADRLGIS